MPKYMTGKKNEMHMQLVCNLVFIKIPEMWLKKKKDICECILVETLKYLQCAYCKLSTIPAY